MNIQVRVCSRLDTTGPHGEHITTLSLRDETDAEYVYESYFDNFRLVSMGNYLWIPGPPTPGEMSC